MIRFLIAVWFIVADATVGSAITLARGDLLVTGISRPPFAAVKTAAILRVDPETGFQSIVSVDGLLQSPLAVAVDANGDLIVVDESGHHRNAERCVFGGDVASAPTGLMR